MPLYDFTATDLLGLFQRLLPHGRVWPRDPDAVQTQVLATLMPTYARLLARDNYLVVDSFPKTAVELLPEWGASVGLPDPCSGLDPTISLREARVVARLAYSGGQSVPYFVAYAAQLGFTVQVTEYAPFRADYSRADDPVNDPAWAYAWLVTAPSETVTYFEADVSRADDALENFGNAALACELNRIKPAHTILQIAYAD